MGMYTRFNLKVKLKADTPEETIALIKDATSVFNGDDRKSLDPCDIIPRYRDMFPAHPFFNVPDCINILGEHALVFGCSLSLKHLINGQWFLECEQEIKNRDDVIQLFLSWLAPHVDAQGECGEFHYCEHGEQKVTFDGEFHLTEPEEEHEQF